MKLFSRLIIVLLPVILVVCIFGFVKYGNGYYFDFYHNFQIFTQKLNYNYTEMISNISSDWDKFGQFIKTFQDITTELNNLNVNDFASFFNAIGLFFRAFGQLFVLLFMFLYYCFTSVILFLSSMLKNSIDLFNLILNPIFLKK